MTLYENRAAGYNSNCQNLSMNKDDLYQTLVGGSIPVVLYIITVRPNVSICWLCLTIVHTFIFTDRSPVYSHITATLQGMSVIRAFKMEDMMTREFDQLQDKHTAAWFAFLSCYRWLGIRFDWITGAYLTFTVFVSLLLSDTCEWNSKAITAE